MKHLPSMSAPPAQGFTLIELMIAMVLGLLVIAGVSAVFLGGSRNYREDDRVARMHDSTRFALVELSNEIEMAGHWAEEFFPPAQSAGERAATVDPNAGADCGPVGVQWKYSTSPAVEIADNVSGASANAAFKCIASSEVVPNTDIISIKRLEGAPTAALTSNETGQIFLRTNNSGGALFRHPTAATDPALVAVAGTTADWAYHVTVYFVRNYFATAGDGIPSLCRKLLQGIDIETEPGSCIPGIENLQLEAGIDTDSDGVANYYTAAPIAAQFSRIVGVRALVLSRSAERLNSYTNAKTYALSNLGNFTPADPYPRELTAATVLVRNAAALSQFNP